MAKDTKIDERLAALEGNVEKLTGILTELIETVKRPAPTAAPKAAPAPVPTNSAFPIPADYRTMVDTILNQSFGIEIKSAGDVAAIDFSILVPETYSNAGKPHWETNKEDRRSRVILSALGPNGVKEWVQKVYDNFDNETKARITMDRQPL